MGQPLPVREGISDGAAIAGSLECPEGFATIFDRHYAAVHRYLARRARAQADDLASMTFVVAFERRGSFRTDSASALPWLFGIATNLLHERHRVELRERGALSLLGGVQVEAVQSFCLIGGDGDHTDQLAQALATLDSARLDVLLLYAWEELSYEEIAEALSVPLGTVRSRLARARAHLRSQLERTNTNPDTAPSEEHG
jgi:DNA-directed RNA polymerase specialized sigma24 family protein